MKAKKAKKAKSFLKSREWAELRQKALERDGHRCFLCGCDDSNASLVVHHILYRRFHKELQDKLENLATLCPRCHFLVHKGSLGLAIVFKLQELQERQEKL